MFHSIQIRRPLVGIAVSFVAGVAFASVGFLSAGFSLLFSIVFLAIFAIGYSKKWLSLIIWPTIFLIGMAHFYLDERIYHSSFSGLDFNNYTALIGRIVQPPHFYSYKGKEFGTWNLILACEGMKKNGVWTRCYDKKMDVKLLKQSKKMTFTLGERIYFQGYVEQNAHPGGESPYTFIVDYSVPYYVFSKHGWSSWWSWVEGFRSYAEQTLALGQRVDTEPFSVVKTLLIGISDATSKETRAAFRDTGTLHIFAISGLHVGMVSLLLATLLKIVGVRCDICGFWLLPMLFFYVVVAGCKVSALRAFMMVAIYFLAPLFQRKPDLPSSIAFAAISILYIDPSEIYSVGFIFSFCVVSMIVMVYSRIPTALRERNGRLNWGQRNGLSLFITSVAAFIGAAPLSAFFFGNISPISLSVNVLVVPLAFLIVLSGSLSLLVGWFAPMISLVFNDAATFFALLLLRTVQFFSSIPFGNMRLSTSSVLAMILWYVGWTLFFVHAKTAYSRRSSLVLVGVSVFLILF